ncbi:MAG: hypothetical protein HY303_11690 [Candidatus Wallbacteria bacterium]|nr:hypothetical protein [Candidatus Wallbacteria bacterium]
MSLIAVVLPHERVTAALLFLQFFLTVTSYYVLKAIRQSKFLEELGASRLPYVYLGTALLIGAVVAAYQRAVHRLPRQKLLAYSTASFAGAMVVFWGLFRVAPDSSWVAAIFYLWVSVFNVMAITQFWSFANDLLDPRQGKRLFGLIGSGGILGGAAGGLIATLCASWLKTENLLLVSALLILPVAPIVGLIHRRDLAGRRNSGELARPAASVAGDPPGYLDGLRLIAASKHLQSIVLIIACMQVVSTIVDYQFNVGVDRYFSRANASAGTGDARRTASVEAASNALAAVARLFGSATLVDLPFRELVGAGQAVPKIGKDAMTAFYGSFFAVLNVSSFAIQLLLTSRLQRNFGVGPSLLLLPLMTIAGSAAFLLLPAFWLACLLKLDDGSLNYSINNATRELLYLPARREVKYKAKAFVDMFFYRFFKGLAAMLLLGLVAAGFDRPRVLAALVLATGVAWIWVVENARREYIAQLRAAIDRYTSGMTQMGSGFFQRMVAREGAGLGQASEQKLILELGNYFMALLGSSAGLESKAREKVELHLDKLMRRIFTLVGQIYDPVDVGRAYGILRMGPDAPRALAIELLDNVVAGRARKLFVTIVSDDLTRQEQAEIGRRALNLDLPGARRYVEEILRAPAPET